MSLHFYVGNYFSGVLFASQLLLWNKMFVKNMRYTVKNVSVWNEIPFKIYQRNKGTRSKNDV